MKIMIIGSGVVGLATGEGFKRMGNDVYFFDKSPTKVERLKAEGYQIYKDEHIDIVFICVPEWNVDSVFETWCGTFFKQDPIVAIRSTTKPGTTERLSKKYPSISIVHNPEFLRERDALYDFLYPDKIVIGRNLKIRDEVDPVLKRLYKPFNAPIFFTDFTTSEFLKLASNAVLFSYISTFNQLKPIADKLGVNSHQVAKILTLDPRISKYGTLHGTEVAGFCLPKDLDSMIKLGNELNVTTILLDAVKSINDELTGDKVEENSGVEKTRKEV